jgi:hypothetical protein
MTSTGMMQRKELSELERWRAAPAQTVIERRACKISAAGVKVVQISLVLLLSACSKVNITPLGSTRDGRRQFEITCNTYATDHGTCHEQAVALCGGSYETQSLGSTVPGVNAYNGQTFTTPAERVLLIACNR